MVVSIKKEENSFIIKFRGPLMATAHKKILDVISDVINNKFDNCRFIVFDFSKVTLVTSVIINAINQKKEDLRIVGLKLVIIAPEGDVFDILSLTGFDKIFPVYQSYEQFKEIYNTK